MEYSEENERLKDQSRCGELRAELKMCMLKTDCCKVYKMTPRECLLSNHESVPNECYNLRTAFFECKRSLVSMFEIIDVLISLTKKKYESLRSMPCGTCIPIYFDSLNTNPSPKLFHHPPDFLSITKNPSFNTIENWKIQLLKHGVKKKKLVGGRAILVQDLCSTSRNTQEYMCHMPRSEACFFVCQCNLTNYFFNDFVNWNRLMQEDDSEVQKQFNICIVEKYVHKDCCLI